MPCVHDVVYYIFNINYILHTLLTNTDISQSHFKYTVQQWIHRMTSSRWSTPRNSDSDYRWTIFIHVTFPRYSTSSF